MKHTKGPWKVETHETGEDFVVITASKFLDICNVLNETNDEISSDTMADAQLIASAPELLEALRSLSGMARDFPSELFKDHPDVVAAFEAIKKAEGK